MDAPDPSSPCSSRAAVTMMFRKPLRLVLGAREAVMVRDLARRLGLAWWCNGWRLGSQWRREAITLEFLWEGCKWVCGNLRVRGGVQRGAGMILTLKSSLQNHCTLSGDGGRR
ncbi:hypothetical protein TIFTF001_022245 [Ficus carica]|uniref:Uncharacterized protein n=1 Tax=Ficus carica TaxID=3494 RepID=A0AA88DJY5_FICCA|nr:hypothetical protein TIFTF001_022245 [Ficus carica]